MNTNIESKSNIIHDSEENKELYEKVRGYLYKFTNEIQRLAILQLSNNEEIKDVVTGKAEEINSTTTDFDTYIVEIIREQSLHLREKIYNYLLTEIIKSEDPAELLKIDIEKMDEILDEDKKNELIDIIAAFIKESIDSKEEKSVAA